jgi:hypothetical protein
MSLSTEEGPLREAAILTRAVENVFRKLIRLLMGRMTLTKLQEIIRVTFVEEAENSIRKEKPGKNVPLTKLALLTGLDTRTLNKVIEEKKSSLPLHQTDKFLREITPEGTVLDYWANNKVYQDQSKSTPLILDLKGKSPSFESLIRDTLSSRGVTATSLLEKLVYSKSVEVNPLTNKVALLNSTYMPFDFSAATAQLEFSFAMIGNLIETLVHNFSTENHARDAFYQRSIWSYRINRNSIPELRSEIKKLLAASEDSVTKVMKSFEENDLSDDHYTAGVGLFYFEDQSAV